MIEITEELKKRMSIDAQIHPEKLDEDLKDHTEILQKYVKVWVEKLKEYKEANGIFNKLYKEKWELIKYKGEIVFETDKEVQIYVEGNDEIIEARRKVDALKIDSDFLERYCKALEGKSYNMRNLLDYLKWSQGER